MLTLSSLYILTATAVAASILPRDAASVQAAVVRVDYSTQVLTNQINALDGSKNTVAIILAALQIQVNEQYLEKNITTWEADCKDTMVTLDSADSTRIINIATSTLEPDFEAMLDAFIQKKPQFTRAQFTSKIRNDLASIRNKTSTATAAFIKVIGSSQKSSALAFRTRLDQKIAEAQKAYQ